MADKPIKTADGGVIRIRRNTAWQEYVVTQRNAAGLIVADYHTDDLKDARDTAAAMAEEINGRYRGAVGDLERAVDAGDHQAAAVLADYKMEQGASPELARAQLELRAMGYWTVFESVIHRFENHLGVEMPKAAELAAAAAGVFREIGTTGIWGVQAVDIGYEPGLVRSRGGGRIVSGRECPGFVITLPGPDALTRFKPSALRVQSGSRAKPTAFVSLTILPAGHMVGDHMLPRELPPLVGWRIDGPLRAYRREQKL